MTSAHHDFRDNSADTTGSVGMPGVPNMAFGAFSTGVLNFRAGIPVEAGTFGGTVTGNT